MTCNLLSGKRLKGNLRSSDNLQYILTVVCQINVTRREGSGGFTKQSRTYAPDTCVQTPDYRKSLQASDGHRRGKGTFQSTIQVSNFQVLVLKARGFYDRTKSQNI